MTAKASATNGQSRPGSTKHCLLLGGGGTVGVGTQYLLKKLGWTASVVDPQIPPHKTYHDVELNGTVRDWTAKDYSLQDLHGRLAAERFDVVIDLTPTLDKKESILICDEAGVPLVNSTMVNYKDDIHIAAYNFVCERPKATRAGHIVASGMNPGAVNAMAEEIIETYEQPNAIIYWEYDDTLPCDGKLPGPATTWSVGESGDEMTEDWTFEVVEEGTAVIHEDAMSWRPQSYEASGVPVEHLGIPPKADVLLIGHEECIYMGWRHDTAVKFIYGFHPLNMRLMREAGYGWKPYLLRQEAKRPLVGRNIVGVACRYLADDSWVGSYCCLENTPEVPLDTNVTCLLVAAGVVASAVLLADGKVQPGVHLTHEVPGWMKSFRSFMEVQPYEINGAELELSHARHRAK